MAHDPDIAMMYHVSDALNRLLWQGEFADELVRLKLKRSEVIRQVMREPTVLTEARQAFEPIAEVQQRRDLHREAAPPWWPEHWEPTEDELRSLDTLVFVPAAWIVLELTIAPTWPALVQFGGWLATLLIAVASALFGFPGELSGRIKWVGEEVAMTWLLPWMERPHRRRLREDVLAPELREWLNRQTEPSFDLRLRLRGADGLALPAGEGPLVQTVAVMECTREVNRDRPAAVGVAGARGVGKTTIVERAVADEFTAPDRKPMLGVHTSAPVRYDARDFVLHLHSCVCRSALNFLADKPDLSNSETQGQWAHQYRKYHRQLIITNMIGTLSRTAAWFVVALTFAQLAWTWHSAAELKQQIAQFARSAWTDPTSFMDHLSLSDAAGLTALATLLWACLNLFSGLIVPALFGTAVKLRRRGTYLNPWYRHPARKALRAVAKQHLRQIRFLQTHTSGWSGKLSAPVTGELGLSRSSARAEQPWTHPEVVQRLRDFLDLVVAVLVDRTRELSGIVVAIDELDKISDADEAHRFLNEIKGIFGIPHCLFLVSVSDDALTAFERRGIPARDAFDSAFTTMIHVRPFTLAESRAWLAQRALGIPEPFVWLCHCFSGGLPRDLGRAAMALHDLQDQHSHLAYLTKAMIQQDLVIKLRAFTHTARQTQRVDTDAPDQPQALIRLLQEAATADLGLLASIALEVWSSGPMPNTPLDTLRAQAACYLLFCLTIVDVFDDNDTLAGLVSVASTLDVPGRQGAVAALARIRQQMAVDTTLARNTLDKFRKALDV